MKKSSAGSSFLLFLTACIWGMAFVSQSKGMEYMQPFTFNGVRSLIGALSLVVYLLLTGKLTKGKFTKAQWKRNLQAGLCCGLALTVASTLQQFGIKYTTVGKAGFITTLYIIFVPLAGVFLKKKVAPVVWFAAVMAAIGMYLLCMTESLVLNGGDIMVFLCALVFAVHIMIVDYFAEGTDGTVVSCIQFFVCGIVCTACCQPDNGGNDSLIVCRSDELWGSLYTSNRGAEGCQSNGSSADYEFGICGSGSIRMDCLRNRISERGSDAYGKADSGLRDCFCSGYPGTAAG